MRAEPATVGAVVIDSLPFSQSGTAAQAKALKDHGVAAVAGYLGVINATRVQYILDAGMAFWGVTLGGHYDGTLAVAQMHGLGMPPGVSVFLDLEGKGAFYTDPIKLAATVNAWGEAVTFSRFLAGLYVGVPQPFTSDELWSLKVQRYWRGQGSVRDRKNNLAEPTKSGWCVSQMFPSFPIGSTMVDANMVGQDYLRRVPQWCIL